MGAEVGAALVWALPVLALEAVWFAGWMIGADFPFVAAGGGVQLPCRGGMAATSRLNDGNACRAGTEEAPWPPIQPNRRSREFGVSHRRPAWGWAVWAVWATSDAWRGESDEKALAELLKDLSEQTTNLVHQEVELAKAEMSVKGKLVAAGAALLAAAGVLGFLAVAALVACAIAGLSEALPVWLAALMVAVVVGGVAGVLAWVGKSTALRGSPPVPEEALESTKEDVEWLKIPAKSAKP